MSNLVTIYKVRCYQAYMASETGSSFTLSPWRGDTVDYKGETISQAVYVLPDGFDLIPDDDSISASDYEAREALHAYFVDADGGYWGLTGTDIPCVVQVDCLDGRVIALTIAE